MREPHEHCRDSEESCSLATLSQPKVSLPPHAEVVVEKPNKAEATDEEQEHEPLIGELHDIVANVGERVAEKGAHDERDSTHCGCASFRNVWVSDRSVITNLLADPAFRQQDDEIFRSE